MKRMTAMAAMILALVVVPRIVQAEDPVPPAAPAAPTAPTEGKGNPMVVLTTSLGDIKIELFADKAPVTVKNFLEYVQAGYYDGTVFHRVIPGFMIQGGGMDGELREKGGQRPPIKNESTNGLPNTAGSLAMARTSVPDSATSQFFINAVDNAFLNKEKAQDGVGYAVFGKVVEGMDVVKKIEAVKTGSKGPHQNVPVDAVVIQTAKVVGGDAK
jgi:cyclophilin family peptidyl-prolyl cis-trans isomerase